MKFWIENLQPDVANALRDRLSDAGHEHAARVVDAELLAVGLGSELPTVAMSEVTLQEWTSTISAIEHAVQTVRDLSASLVARNASGRLVVVVAPPVLRSMQGAGLMGLAGAFLSTFSEVASVELAESGLSVNTLVAGWSSPFSESFGESTPLGRLAEPDEIARACSFLLDQESAAFITGATLAVDGGWSVTRTPGLNPLDSQS